MGIRIGSIYGEDATSFDIYEVVGAYTGDVPILHGERDGIVLLPVCVAGIANGPVRLVVFYEQEVKDRVVTLGLTAKEKICETTGCCILAASGNTVNAIVSELCK